ncbi:uteroglobin [Trichechus manatus latirostris]|uniref:Uteroglobin n=1 Tax=Trichechus manatus latirostris TaxID=127582 RepID=A0A2Y9RQQ3_TRIMA|nr:uteroglobin [Trichechus manatus latirostris]
MKLAVLLALVTLALCCSSASAEVCRSFLKVIEHLFMGTLSGFEAAILPFNLDPNMIDASTQMKKLMDSLSQNVKNSLMKLTVNSFLRLHYEKWVSKVP